LGILRDMSTTYVNGLCLLALSLGVSTVATGHAQSLATMHAPQGAAHEAGQAPLCDPDLIDGTFTFANLPAGEQTVSLHFQNKSNAACRLHGEAGPTFAGANVEMCWLCDQANNVSYAPERQAGNEILLAPGGRAALDVHWTSSGESCQWADWVTFYFRWTKQTGYLFIPAEWPMHMCSMVNSTGYRAEANSPSTGEGRGGVLRVSVMEAAVYSDERATLHAEVSGQTTSVAQPAGCASLYSVRQGPSLGTRLDPLLTMGSVKRPSYTPEQMEEDKKRAWPSWKTDHLRRCDIAGGQAIADAEISAADLADVTHIEWRTAAGPGEDPIFVMATTHFSVIDVDTLAPNWGDPVGGIRAGLSIDRESFSLGERIPLHLRWENVNAAVPLAEGECKEPQPALEIQDSQHRVVRTIPIEQLCSGHGWGPFTIQKSKAQRTFIELTTGNPSTRAFWSEVAGDLPGPGVYYVVSVWSPRVLDAPEANTDKTLRIFSSGRFGRVYATARSLPVRVVVASVL
jgi:hypothetical protein